MSYTPTVWKNGDKITSEKLNKLENAVASEGVPAIIYATLTGELVDDVIVNHCDKSLSELLAAIDAGSFIVLRHGDIFSPMCGFSNDNITFSDYYIHNGKLYVTSIKVEAEDVVTVSEMAVTGDTPN